MLDATWLNDTADKARDALARIRRLSIDPQLSAPWPLTMPAVEYVEELKAHLLAVGEMMMFLQQVSRLDAHAAAGSSTQEIATAIGKLPEVTSDPLHTAGFERSAYQHKIIMLKRQYGCG